MNTGSPNSKFRDDINGLRALAVLPVLLFHAGLSSFQGGFLGVDVFFVISGFLIAGQIHRDVCAGSFSFLHFYDSRARRILPALLVVALVTSLAALFLMLPYSLKNYGQSLVATMLSANNILLLQTSGYWSIEAGFKPLYHTWSLAVEEQFYLLAPIVIFLCFRLTRYRTAGIVAVCALLLASSWMASALIEEREFTFLMLTTRAWELLVGALLAFTATSARERPNLALFGLALLLIAYVFPHALGSNQAIVVALPVIGTALVIRYCSPASLPGRLLSLKPLAIIGLISYSIYLWHQPILAFLRLASMESPSPATQVIFSMLAIPLGYLSWRFVEQKFRDRQWMPTRHFYAAACGTTVLLIAGGLGLHRSYGLVAWAPQYSYGEDPKVYVERPFALRFAGFHANGGQRVLVVGNSFARDFINMLNETGYGAGRDVVYWEGDCLHRSNDLLESLLAQAQLVVFAQNWGRPGSNPRDVDDAFSCYQELRSKSRARVVVLGAKNFGWNNDFVRTKPGSLDNREHRVYPLESVIRFNKAAQALIGPDFLDLMEAVMDREGRVPIFTSGGRFITYDTNHLTRDGAAFVGARLFARFDFLSSQQNEAQGPPAISSAGFN